MRAFPAALASLHGLAFVQKMLEWYVVADRGVLFHIERGGQVVGYCGGISTLQSGLPGAFTSISQYAFWSMAASYLRKPWLLFHRENVAKRSGIVRNIAIRLRLRSQAAPNTSTGFIPHCGLVVIGVDPAHRGKGIGDALIQQFEQLAVAKGVRLVRLSVKPSNAPALALYGRHAWTIAEDRDQDLLLRKFL
jgi:ribosomal protein S18 acetylase RimI-like enzyme